MNRFIARLAGPGRRRVVNEDSRAVSEIKVVVLVHYLQFLVRLFQLFILHRSGVFFPLFKFLLFFIFYVY